MPNNARCVKVSVITLLLHYRIFFSLKDLEVSEQPLQGKYVEMNKRELPVRGNVGYNKKAKLFEDLSVCHCKVKQFFKELSRGVFILLC